MKVFNDKEQAMKHIEEIKRAMKKANVLNVDCTDKVTEEASKIFDTMNIDEPATPIVGRNDGGYSISLWAGNNEALKRLEQRFIDVKDAKIYLDIDIYANKETEMSIRVLFNIPVSMQNDKELKVNHCEITEVQTEYNCNSNSDMEDACIIGGVLAVGVEDESAKIEYSLEGFPNIRIKLANLSPTLFSHHGRSSVDLVKMLRDSLVGNQSEV